MPGRLLLSRIPELQNIIGRDDRAESRARVDLGPTGAERVRRRRSRKRELELVKAQRRRRSTERHHQKRVRPISRRQDPGAGAGEQDDSDSDSDDSDSDSDDASGDRESESEDEDGPPRTIISTRLSRPRPMPTNTIGNGASRTFNGAIGASESARPTSARAPGRGDGGASRTTTTTTTGRARSTRTRRPCPTFETTCGAPTPTDAALITGQPSEEAMSSSSISSTARNAAIAGGTIGGVAAIVAIIFLVYLFRRKRGSRRSLDSDSSSNSMFRKFFWEKGFLPQGSLEPKTSIKSKPSVRSHRSGNSNSKPAISGPTINVTGPVDPSSKLAPPAWKAEDSFAQPTVPKSTFPSPLPLTPRTRRLRNPLGQNPPTPQTMAGRLGTTGGRLTPSPRSLLPRTFFRSSNASSIDPHRPATEEKPILEEEPEPEREPEPEPEPDRASLAEDPAAAPAAAAATATAPREKKEKKGRPTIQTRSSSRLAPTFYDTQASPTGSDGSGSGYGYAYVHVDRPRSRASFPQSPPPAVLRHSEAATILSQDSEPPRFRSVHSWVDNQAARHERRLKASDETGEPSESQSQSQPQPHSHSHSHSQSQVSRKPVPVLVPAPFTSDSSPSKHTRKTESESVSVSASATTKTDSLFRQHPGTKVDVPGFL